MTEKNWLASYRSGDANPCPPPGTWQDSVFVMLTDAPLPTSDHVFMLAASWVDRVLKCGDERALAWYRRHAIEYINPGFGGISAFVRVLEADPVGNRDALLAIAADRRHPMLSRSKALEAVVRELRIPPISRRGAPSPRSGRERVIVEPAPGDNLRVGRPLDLVEDDRPVVLVQEAPQIVARVPAGEFAGSCTD